jgi:pimeloyl-ACP methyl ester carboxylesterase
MTPETRTFPGARPPDLFRRVDADGVGISVYEWGHSHDPVIFLAHGGSDFARTFDVLAPRIAQEGWRVVTWDHRGHGDSDHAALYSWDGDIRDALAVMSSTTTDPSPVVAHSKGGALMMQLAEASPYRISRMVNIDGMPSKRRMPDVPDHDQSRLMATEIGAWLDYRHEAHSSVRKPGTLIDLAQRRAKMNPRLSIEWLEYLVTVGARHDSDGWRWKLDPAMRFGGFGPWRPEWSALRMASLSVPFLGLLGTVDEPMGWGARARDITPWLPANGRLEVLDGVGHFIHIEEPERVAHIILEFLS